MPGLAIGKISIIYLDLYVGGLSSMHSLLSMIYIPILRNPMHDGGMTMTKYSPRCNLNESEPWSCEPGPLTCLRRESKTKYDVFIWGCLKMRNPQVTMDFNTKMVWWLGWFGGTPWLRQPPYLSGNTRKNHQKPKHPKPWAVDSPNSFDQGWELHQRQPAPVKFQDLKAPTCYFSFSVLWLWI